MQLGESTLEPEVQAPVVDPYDDMAEAPAPAVDASDADEGREPSDAEPPFSVDPDDYGRTITPEAVGLSLKQWLEGKIEPGGEPSDEESVVLDALLSPNKRRYTEVISRGRVTVEFTTVSARCVKNALAILQEYGKDNEGGFAVAYSAMLIAQHLVAINGDELCPDILDQKEFESMAALESRFEYCLSLPAPVSDVIGTLVNGFNNKVKRALRRNLLNF